MSVSVIWPGRPVSLSEADGTVDVFFTWSTETVFDLVGLYELTNGAQGAVQAPQPDISFGNLLQPPYIRLRNSEHFGVKFGIGQQLLQINAAHAADFRRLLIFAYAVDSGETFARAGRAAVTVGHPTQGSFDFRLGHGRLGLPTVRQHFSRNCVLATLERGKDGKLALIPQGKCVRGDFKEICDAYGFDAQPTLDAKN
jgi:tellurite resistance protein TerA